MKSEIKQQANDQNTFYNYFSDPRDTPLRSQQYQAKLAEHLCPFSHSPFWNYKPPYQSPFLPYPDPYYLNQMYWRNPPFNYPYSQNYIIKQEISQEADKLSEDPKIHQEKKTEVVKKQSSSQSEEIGSDYDQSAYVRHAAARHSKKYIRVNAPNYYWTLEQNKRYVEFIRTHEKLFDLSLSEKKNMKINVMMSKKVKTRNSYQCRSHHQKMIKKYGTIQNLIKSITYELNIFSKIDSLNKLPAQEIKQIKLQKEKEIIS